MKIHEILGPDLPRVAPDATLLLAAELMTKTNSSLLAVCVNDHLSGVVTDRDVVLRTFSDGCDPQSTRVEDIMSREAIYVFLDQEAEDAVHIMHEHHLRRLPVLDHEHRVMGVVSLADILRGSASSVEDDLTRHSHLSSS